MPDRAFVTVYIDGHAVRVVQGAMVSAALLNAQVPCRVSVSGEPRTALCGMGICFECRAEIDGRAHRRTCQLTCREGMQIRTQP